MRTFTPGEVVEYEGRVWDVDANAWGTFGRGTNGDQPKPRCLVVAHVRGIGAAEHLRVRLMRWPQEFHEYVIFEMGDVKREPTLRFERGQEIAFLRVLLRRSIAKDEQAGVDSPVAKSLLERMEALGD